MQINEFYTVPNANTGIKLPLYDNNGNDTGEFIRVRGTDSDEFVLAQESAIKSRVALEAIEDINEQMELKKRIRATLLSSLVVDWSFDTPCTVENVTDALLKAPAIAEAIDVFAANRENFIEKKSKPLGILQRLSSILGLNKKTAEHYESI